MKVNIQPTTQARQAELRTTGDYEVTLNNLTQTGVDPTHLFGTYLVCNIPRNQTKLCLPDMDKLWTQQRQLTEFEKRKPIVDQMHKTYLEQSHFNLLSWRNGLAGWWNHVKGFSIQPAAYTYTVRLENVWIDK